MNKQYKAVVALARKWLTKNVNQYSPTGKEPNAWVTFEVSARSVRCVYARVRGRGYQFSHFALGTPSAFRIDFWDEEKYRKGKRQY